jgi:ribosomal silencing factor RsfS
MKVELKFKPTYTSTDVLIISIEGPYRQITALVDAIRKSIEEDRKKEVEHSWEHVWASWEEI